MTNYSSKPKTVVGLGELLWDMLPSGKKLGGAPANFAYISSLFGNRGVVASRVGVDDLGSEALEQLKLLQLEDTCIQHDSGHPTGTVGVALDSYGQPTFNIFENVAWDYLEWNDDWSTLAQSADVVCFGSLAQRSAQSRETIHRFLNATRHDALRIFDVNLRQNYFSRELLEDSLALADVAKLNDAELPIVLSTLGLPASSELDNTRALLERFSLRLVCLTKGGAGSVLVAENASDEHPGFEVAVSDTVGAGDAFTAALAYYFALGAPLSLINTRANRVGSWVASVPGAMPSITREEFQRRFAAAV